MAYLPSIRDGSHRKRQVQQFFRLWVCIRWHGNVFTEPLPSYDSGDTHTDTQTARWSHKPTSIFFKIGIPKTANAISC
jgi:hypothetical protein